MTKTLTRQTVSFKVRPDTPLRSNQRQVGATILGDEMTVKAALTFLKALEALSMESAGPQLIAMRVDSELDEIQVTFDGDIELMVNDTLPEAMSVDHDLLLITEAGVMPWPPQSDEGGQEGDGGQSQEES